MTCDSAIMNKAIDPIHIDFLLDSADQSMKTTFIAQVNKEFRMREWANEYDDGSFMTIHQKVAKLKASLIDG